MLKYIFNKRNIIYQQNIYFTAHTFCLLSDVASNCPMHNNTKEMNKFCFILEILVPSYFQQS